jgi:hypothetical protein
MHTYRKAIGIPPTANRTQSRTPGGMFAKRFARPIINANWPIASMR